MKFISAVLFALFAMLCQAVPALAQETPDALVKRVTDEVVEAIRTDKDIQAGNSRKAIELVETRVLPHFNFLHMTALAVGKDWAKANPPQKQALAAEFRTLLVRTYSNALTSYKNQTIQYKPFKAKDGETDVLVRTEIRQPGGTPIQLDYSLEKLDNGWKVFDVVVGGVSLVTNYRDSFAQEVRNGGIDGLLSSLQAKNKATESSAKADKK